MRTDETESPPRSSTEFRVVAIVAAYNEADIIEESVGDLIDQGVDVYLIDNASTDTTVAQVERFLGSGLLGVERFPPAGASTEFEWAALLRRKEALAAELGANWFIHHDADEFREGPWPGRTLKSAIQAVDSLGFNAIDFELLNFRVTRHDMPPGEGVRTALAYYERGTPIDRPQIRCWKGTGAPVDLVSSGGHDASFEGRRVFPIRFLLRHYPIRGQAHGRRKVLAERVPRFLPAERARGWHVQYDDVPEDWNFVHPSATLERFDAEQVRLRLCVDNLPAEALRDEVRALELAVARAVSERQDAQDRLVDVSARHQLDIAHLREEIGRLSRELDHAGAEVHRVLSEAHAQAAALQQSQSRVAALEHSWTWRLTASARWVAARIGLGPHE
jgi:Glycosyl transferase family 2